MSPLAHLPRRVLTALELETLVADCAAEHDLWRPEVRADPAQRTYAQLHGDDHVTVWLICWMAGHDTGFHDHDGSAGALTVVQGALREERLSYGEPQRRVLRLGDSLTFGPSAIHRVAHTRGAPAISLHAYSPPLRSMGSYGIAENGELHRLALGDDEELRPLSEVPQAAAEPDGPATGSSKLPTSDRVSGILQYFSG